MPKILALQPGGPAAGSVRAAKSPSAADSRLTPNRSDRSGADAAAERLAGGFDNILTQARRREPARASEPASEPPKSEPTKSEAAQQQSDRADASSEKDRASTAATKQKERLAITREATPKPQTKEASDGTSQESAADGEQPDVSDAVADPTGEAEDPKTQNPAVADHAKKPSDATTPAADDATLVAEVPQAKPAKGSKPAVPAPNDAEGEGADPAPVAEGEDKVDPAHADADDVRAGQATPVLIASYGQPQTPAEIDPNAATDSTGAESADGTVPSGAIDPLANLGVPTPAAGGAAKGAGGTAGQKAVASAAAKNPEVAIPALGAEAVNADGVQPQTAPAFGAARSNGADVVESLEPTDADLGADAAAEAPAAGPAAGAHSAPDVSTIAADAARAMESLAGHAKPQAAAGPATAGDVPALPPEVQFAEDNHPSIVAGVRGQLLPSGGTMQIRLDPPELGPLAVTIRLNDGVMEASFETSNDQATRLLSHSLSTLKTSLEAQGVNVERLHVQQAPKTEQSNAQGGNDRDRDQQQNQARDPQQEHAARQENQRREMLRRMWAKLRGADDPLDMVA